MTEGTTKLIQLKPEARLELERIVIDGDAESAIQFVVEHHIAGEGIDATVALGLARDLLKRIKKTESTHCKPPF